jgi:hypothetical protein
LLAALALAGAASALDVDVRVEGVTKTLFGATEPSLEVFTGTLAAADGSTHELAQPTALGALEAASAAGEFFYRLQSQSFGLFVDQIGRHVGAGTSGWVFKVNGVSPPVGAAEYVLKDGDVVLWYHATFGEQGGPATLALRSEPQAGCYRALAQDDAGKLTRIGGVVFLVDGRRVRSASGRICPAGSWRTLRATRAGAVRSAVVTR